MRQLKLATCIAVLIAGASTLVTGSRPKIWFDDKKGAFLVSNSKPFGLILRELDWKNEMSKIRKRELKSNPYQHQRFSDNSRVSVRALYRPKYFHGGLFAPGLHWTAPPCRNPLTAYLPLGQILCRARPRPARPPCTNGSVCSRNRLQSKREGNAQTTTREIPSDNRSRPREQSQIKIGKRGPGCMRRCLEARLLHPAQCHALC